MRYSVGIIGLEWKPTMPTDAVLDLRFRLPLRAWTMPLICGALLAGCAGGNSVSGGSHGSSSAHAYDRVLIVGLSSDYNQRCAFEFSLMSQLNANTPIAGASCDFLKPEDPLTRANILKVVASTKADAVVTTRALDSQFKAMQGGTMDDKGGVAYKPDDIYESSFDDGHGVVVGIGEVVQYPPITVVAGTVHLLTRVYDTASKSQIDNFQTKVGNIRSETDFLLDVTPPIADQLRRDGIIR
jgi:hypothetical protein